MKDRSEKTIGIYDRNGIFVLMVEGSTQGPIILETEGPFSSFDDAQARQRNMKWLRSCICRVVPVSGNELLALDMIRMQLQDMEDES